MRFFQRKKKTNRSPVENLDDTTTAAKNNDIRHGLSSLSQPSGVVAREGIDERHDVNASSSLTNQNINNEVRDDSFRYSVASSESTEDVLDEMSNLSFSSETETPRLKTYLMEHLLGCVDFIEECTGTISNTTINNGAACTDVNVHNCPSLNNDTTKFAIMTEDGVVEMEPVEDETTEAKPAGIKSWEAITSIKTKRPAAKVVVTEPNKAKTLESGPGGSALLELKQAECTNDFLAGVSGAAATVPKSSYRTVAPKTNDDFVAVLAEVDKVIDSHVARLCGELFISGDDDLSLFPDMKVSPYDYDDMLFT
ncbi:hypothetical protein HJC23_002994 [Cyclotella cryptica]|uniref:Uncharacterized protein n=1 Tax=Cyclotella cryptica TaxID=29204 RepID=A0ABD3PS91_9STRA|eukprot:CCRYP_011800-RA/>CCRYP_011800-RA protein AED:0.37 eAED:0.37 QI:0/-1/0/1/-1/1/1/0/309